MKFKEASIIVLSENGNRPMHYTDIYEEIKRRALTETSGATPSFNVLSAIRRDISSKKSHFEALGNGMYTLKKGVTPKTFKQKGNGDGTDGGSKAKSTRKQSKSSTKKKASGKSNASSSASKSGKSSGKAASGAKRSGKRAAKGETPKNKRKRKQPEPMTQRLANSASPSPDTGTLSDGLIPSGTLGGLVASPAFDPHAISSFQYGSGDEMDAIRGHSGHMVTHTSTSQNYARSAHSASHHPSAHSSSLHQPHPQAGMPQSNLLYHGGVGGIITPSFTPSLTPRSTPGNSRRNSLDDEDDGEPSDDEEDIGPLDLSAIGGSMARYRRSLRSIDSDTAFEEQHLDLDNIYTGSHSSGRTTPTHSVSVIGSNSSHNSHHGHGHHPSHHSTSTSSHHHNHHHTGGKGPRLHSHSALNTSTGSASSSGSSSSSASDSSAHYHAAHARGPHHSSSTTTSSSSSAASASVHSHGRHTPSPGMSAMLTGGKYPPRAAGSEPATKRRRKTEVPSSKSEEDLRQHASNLLEWSKDMKRRASRDSSYDSSGAASPVESDWFSVNPKKTSTIIDDNMVSVSPAGPTVVRIQLEQLGKPKAPSTPRERYASAVLASLRSESPTHVDPMESMSSLNSWSRTDRSRQSLELDADNMLRQGSSPSAIRMQQELSQSPHSNDNTDTTNNSTSNNNDHTNAKRKIDMELESESPPANANANATASPSNEGLDTEEESKSSSTSSSAASSPGKGSPSKRSPRKRRNAPGRFDKQEIAAAIAATRGTRSRKRRG